jgi:hypothetical protein
MTDSEPYWFSVQKIGDETVFLIHDDLGTYSETYSLTWHRAAVQRSLDLKEAGFIFHPTAPEVAP